MSDFLSGLGSATGDLAGSVVSGLFGRSSAKSAMKFEEYMSSTAYQRAAKDLEKAGLNRVLAYANPASTPNAPSPTIEAPKLGSSFQAGSSAAAQRRVQNETEKLLQEQQQKTAAEKETALASATELLSRVDLNAANAENARAQAKQNAFWRELQDAGAGAFRWLREKFGDDKPLPDAIDLPGKLGITEQTTGIRNWISDFILGNKSTGDVPGPGSSARGAARQNPPHKTRPNIKGGAKRGSR